MSVYDRVYVTVVGFFFAIGAGLLYFANKYNRLPEAFIIIGCSFLIITIVYLLCVYLKVSKASKLQLPTGPVLAKAFCLCKSENKSSQIDVMLYDSGMLLSGEFFPDTVFSYPDFTVKSVSKFGLQVQAKDEQVYEMTFSSVLSMKALLTVFEEKQVMAE